MYLAVTGGCGYIGSVLTPRLSEIADQIDVLDIRPPSWSQISSLDPKQFHYKQIDLADAHLTQDLMPKYDVIVHLAALVGYPSCNKFPSMAVRSNVSTTRNILTHKRKGATTILASTVSNYGKQQGIVDEKTKIRPNSVYAITKHKAERIALTDPNSLVYRFAGAFGYSPHMRHDNLIHDFVSKAAKGDTIAIYESHFVRQFIHIDDIVESIVHGIMNRDTMRGEIYNVGNPKIEITKQQLVDIIHKFCQFKSQPDYLGKDLEKRNYKISFKKLLATGFKPERTLEMGLESLVKFYRSQKSTTVSEQPERIRDLPA